MVKIMNNLNVCSAHRYLYPWSRFKQMKSLPNMKIEVSFIAHIMGDVLMFDISGEGGANYT